MNGAEAIFAAWLSLQANIAGGPVPLHPPAEPAMIERVERELGHPLSEELLLLYGIADGQREPGGEAPSTARTPLFVRLRFASLEQALDVRRRLLAEGADETFATDWLPFATDGDGAGWAVDLVADEAGPAGRVVGFSARGSSTAYTSIAAALLRGLRQLDPLQLHSDGDDPTLNDLGRWYRERSTDPSRPTEQAFTKALTPWLGGRPLLPALEDPDNYEWLLASILDQNIACDGIHGRDAAGADEGVRLAHDWLLDTGRITARRYRKLEAIRRDDDGARETLLAGTTRETLTENGGCVYVIRYGDI